MNSKYHKISLVCPEENQDLQAQLTQDSLKFKFMIKKDRMTKEVYEGQLKSIEMTQQLTNFCENLNEVLQHIKEPQNLKVDHTNKAIKILGKMIIGKDKKQKILDLAKVKLILTNTISEDPVSIVVQNCNKKDDLTSDEIKEMFQVIVDYLERMNKKKVDQKSKVQAQKSNYIAEMEKLRHQIIKTNKIELAKMENSFNQKLEDIRKLFNIKYTQMETLALGRLQAVKLEINKLPDMILLKFNKKIEDITAKNQQKIQFIKGNEIKKQADMFNELKEKIEQKVQQKTQIKAIQIDSYHHKNKKFDVKQNIAIAKQNLIQIFGKQCLPMKCKFSFKIFKRGTLYVMRVGIIATNFDRSYEGHKNKQIIYLASDGYYCQAGIKAKCTVDNSIKQNDAITIQMDLENGHINFKNNNSSVLELNNNPMLKDKSIKWIPYVFLGNQNDTVEFGDIFIL